MVFVMIPEVIIPYLNSCFVQGSIGQDGRRGADGRTGFCVSIDLRYYSQSSILLNFGLMSL